MDTSKPGPRPIRVHLLLLLGAAMLVGCLAIVGEFQASRTPPPAPQVHPARGDGRVLAGQRVDFILLGLPIDQVEATLGTGKIRPEKDSILYLFDEAGVHVAARKGRVHSIQVLNPNLRTPDGLGVGVDVDRVVRRFGEGYEYEGRGATEYTLHYWSQGIHFRVKDARVASLLVSEPVLP